MIAWLCDVAKLNLKRAGMYSNERELSPVNFVLNILHVLHVMCKKIDVAKVDKNFILHPQCRTKPGNETTILADNDQLERNCIPTRYLTVEYKRVRKYVQ